MYTNGQSVPLHPNENIGKTQTGIVLNRGLSGITLLKILLLQAIGLLMHTTDCNFKFYDIQMIANH